MRNWKSAPSSVRLYMSRILPITKMGNYTALLSEERESTWGLIQLHLVINLFHKHILIL